MNTRAILTGTLVWILIFSTFTLLTFIPALKDALTLQGIIVAIFIPPFALLGATIYYKKGAQTNGLTLGITMISIALILDALITVPIVEIPHGGSYFTFFTNPLLWLLVVENIVVIFLYWKTKVASSISSTS